MPRESSLQSLVNIAVAVDRARFPLLLPIIDQCRSRTRTGINGKLLVKSQCISFRTPLAVRFGGARGTTKTRSTFVHYGRAPRNTHTHTPSLTTTCRSRGRQSIRAAYLINTRRVKVYTVDTSAGLSRGWNWHGHHDRSEKFRLLRGSENVWQNFRRRDS